MTIDVRFIRLLTSIESYSFIHGFVRVAYSLFAASHLLAPLVASRVSSTAALRAQACSHLQTTAPARAGSAARAPIPQRRGPSAAVPAAQVRGRGSHGHWGLLTALFVSAHDLDAPVPNAVAVAQCVGQTMLGPAQGSVLTVGLTLPDGLLAGLTCA